MTDLPLAAVVPSPDVAPASPVAANDGPSADTNVLHVAPPAAPTALDGVVDRIEGMGMGFGTRDAAAMPGGVSTLAPEAEPGDMRGVEAEAAPEPTFDEAMANFHKAASHAIEVNLVSTAGSAMTGSMSKLMSGN